MRDPLPKQYHRSTHQTPSQLNFQQSPKNGNKNTNMGRRTKSDYFWNFNKGVTCKFGQKCKFIERCSYCDSPSHSQNACPKLDKKDFNNRRANADSTKGEGQREQSFKNDELK